MRLKDFNLSSLSKRELVQVVEVVSQNFDDFKKEVFFVKNQREIIDHLYSLKEFFFLIFKNRYLDVLETNSKICLFKNCFIIETKPLEIKFIFNNPNSFKSLEDEFFYHFDFSLNNFYQDFNNFLQLNNLNNKEELLYFTNSFCIITDFNSISIKP